MSMEKHKISVIIPVYKVEEYLPKCLDSVINQTYKNIEIILVNDGSPDKSGVICDMYAGMDDRITVIHKQNEGVAKARNDALDIAKGDYIGFVDSDDWIEPDMFEFLMNNLIKYDADISMCGETVYENGKIISSKSNGSVSILDQDGAKKLTVKGGSMGLIWNKIYKKSILDNVRFSSEYGCSEDLIFVYQAVQHAKNMVCVNKAKYNYFRREGGITKGEFGYGAFGVVDVMRNMLKQETGTDIYPFCIKGFTDAAYTVLSGIITNKKCEDRFSELVQEIISYRSDILFGGHHSAKDKVKVLLLSISPKLYRLVIRSVRGM